MDPATLESLIIQELWRSSEISRRDLADQLAVARSTAGRRVDSLIKRGILREKGLEERDRAGRPRRFLELCAEHGRFVGFDFDARAIYASLIDFAEQPVAEKKISLSSRPTREEVIDYLREQIKDFRSQDPSIPIFGFGIGTPGRVIKSARVAVGYDYIRGWEDVDLLKELSLDPSVLHIENNTRATALGEYWLSKPDSPSHLICLSIRTGISAAIISNGQLLRGQNELSGEIRNWRVGGGPKSPTLEGSATVLQFGNHGKPSVRRWNRFVKDCRAGESEALAQLESLVDMHADTLARLIQIADPEKVVIAGAFNAIGEPYLQRVREATELSRGNHFTACPPIEFVSAGEFTGARGAAALAAQHYKPSP
ncbi:MAG: ROK family transcriptional regulator [Verrucomicrobiota bacterium]